MLREFAELRKIVNKNSSLSEKIEETELIGYIQDAQRIARGS